MERIVREVILVDVFVDWISRLSIACRLFAGKWRRLYLVHLRKGYVQRQMAIRQGNCIQCGSCCTLLFTCPMLSGQRLCRIYDSIRWRACRAFPIDQRDIDDTALVGGSCGYRFTGQDG